MSYGKKNDLLLSGLTCQDINFQVFDLVLHNGLRYCISNMYKLCLCRGLAGQHECGASPWQLVPQSYSVQTVPFDTETSHSLLN